MSEDLGPARPASTSRRASGEAAGVDAGSGDVSHRGWASPAGPETRSVAPAVGPAAAAQPAFPTSTSRSEPAGRIPLRPLDVGDILDGTFGVIRRNPRTVLGLAALLVSVQQVLAFAAQVGTGDIPTLFGAFAGGATVQLVGGIGAIVGLVLSAVIGTVLTGMIVVVVADDVLGHRVGAGEVWRRVRPRVPALVVAALIAGVVPYLGLILLVVPGVLLWGGWALTTPALVMERLGPLRALRRAWRLGFPDFWRVWGIRSLSVLLSFVMQALVVIPFAALGALLAAVLGARSGDPLPLIALACVALGSVLGGVLTQPFLAGVLALLYVDRRMRAEGLDIVMQQRERAAGRLGGAWTGHAPPVPVVGSIFAGRSTP